MTKNQLNKESIMKQEMIGLGRMGGNKDAGDNHE